MQEKLHAENAVLAQQLAQVQTDNESLSNRLAAVGDANSLSAKEHNELLKLRGEVGLLRRQTNELGKLPEANRQIRDQNTTGQNETNQISPEDRFQLNEWHTINAMKELGLAMRIYAEDHNEQYATNFDQLKDELGGATNFAGNVDLNAFEFINAGLVNDTMPDKIIFRERVPRVAPNGWWYRAYGLADGSVQSVFGDNQGDEAKFHEFEKQHSPPLNQ